MPFGMEKDFIDGYRNSKTPDGVLFNKLVNRFIYTD